MQFGGTTCKAEVDYFHSHVIVDQNVGHLKITMCKVLVVHVLHTCHDLREYFITLILRQSFCSRISAVGTEGVDSAELHYNKYLISKTVLF